MSFKYNRHSPVINRQFEQSVDEDTWLHRFEKSLLKGAVQTKKQDSSLFDQINTIMNGKSKFHSVDAAVQDMKERSGLAAYIEKINKSSKKDIPASKKIASDNQDAIDKKVEMTPIVLKKQPNIKKTIENYINATKGNLSVPAILDKIRSIHCNDVSNSKDWEDDLLIILVSKLNLEAKKNNPGTFQDYSNLGSRDSSFDSDIDPENSDAFHCLTPVKQ